MPSLLPLKKIQALFFLVLIVKLFVYVWLTVFQTELIQMGGNDSDFYNDFALALIADENASSIWPFILRELNDFGFYNRNVISWLLFALASLVIPFVFAASLPKPTNASLQNQHPILFWHVATLIALYPTILFFTFDIYRDVIMILIFGLCLVLAKHASDRYSLITISQVIGLLLLTYVLYLFRSYLGFSVLIAILFYWFSLLQLRLSYLIPAYFLILLVLQFMGLFDSLFSYRGEDGFAEGDSTLGIGLIGKNPIEFLFLYLSSGLLQLFGFYLTTIKAWVLFLVESVLFIRACLYIVKNKRFLTPFLRCVLVFSVVYGTIWILGNDNLGTAIRLRIYNYLSILIVAASIYFLKFASTEGDMSAKEIQ